MGQRIGQPLAPIRAERPDIELGDQHADERAQAHLPGDEMSLVQPNGSPGQRVNLNVEGGRDMKMRIVRASGIRVPVIDKELPVAMVEQSVLVRDRFSSRGLKRHLAIGNWQPN